MLKLQLYHCLRWARTSAFKMFGDEGQVIRACYSREEHIGTVPRSRRSPGANWPALAGTGEDGAGRDGGVRRPGRDRRRGAEGDLVRPRQPSQRGCASSMCCAIEDETIPHVAKQRDMLGDEVLPFLNLCAPYWLPTPGIATQAAFLDNLARKLSFYVVPRRAFAKGPKLVD